MKPQAYAAMAAQQESHWWYVGMRAIARALVEDLPGCGSWHVLDAGCGSGANLSLLQGWGEVVGCDIASQPLSQARLMAPGRLVQSRVQALPFGSEAFDMVASFDVLYHQWVEDDVAALRELGRVLRPGGYALVRVPALRWLWSDHDQAVASRHRYSAAEMRDRLERASLRPVRLSYANSLLLGPIWLARRLRLSRGAQRTSDVRPTPRPMNRLLTGVLALEARWLRRRDLPLGVSLLALAHKEG